jgi:hypothetical protein
MHGRTASARARTAATIVFVAAVAAGRLAHAQEDLPLTKGIAADTWVAAVDDRSVLNLTSGEKHNEQSVLLGISVLGHLGELALGATLDGFPGLFGDSRLSAGGLAGWQRTVDLFRLQILAEAGGHCFRYVGSTLFASQNGPANHWLPYAGLRVGATMSFSKRGYSQMGLWVFARQDIGEATVTSVSAGWGSGSTYTDFRLGGFQAGVALRFGMSVTQQPGPLPSLDEG